MKAHDSVTRMMRRQVQTVRQSQMLLEVRERIEKFGIVTTTNRVRLLLEPY